ncbi:serpin family protein [Clostridia bacterium]|nr:serpin family protein [Clostridia bacterium]
MFLKINTKIVNIVLILVMLLGFTGCEEAIEPSEVTVNEELSLANTSFSFDMLRMLNKEEEDGNVLFSPLSISIALSMALNGSQGETRDEMVEMLSYQELDMNSINQSYADYQNYLDNHKGDTELYLKNSIWIREGEEIKTDYLDVIAKQYLARLDYLDFNDPDSATAINNWIEEATKGKISDMIAPPLPSDAVAYLINAIYFKGDWAEQFDKDSTFDAEFYKQNGQTSTVKMMNDKRTVWYMENENMEAVRIPYVDENRSMIILLPKETDYIDNLINRLDEKIFSTILESFYEVDDMILQIPKFEMEYGTKNLNQSLKNLGMNIAFTSDADFSGMRDGLYISNVLHKAFIEVNEQGSEAAAATVVDLKETAMESPKKFRADRPFLFLIYDEDSNSILFLGKYSE